MTALLLAVALPCVYWTQAIDTQAMLKEAAIARVCVPAAQADAWRTAGFTVTIVSDADLASRVALPSPGTEPRPGLASPTRSPWIVSSGWRFLRAPRAKYKYETPVRKGALAAAEAAAYGADALLKIDPADARAVGEMLKFVESVPELALPAVADLAVVDDGLAATGEVMNLLARRNLLFAVVSGPTAGFPITIAIGTPEYPREQAADPSSFALKIRRQLTDERRALRVYGSEVVICRLTADAGKARLHLINYGGREIEGLRVRVRGTYGGGVAYVAGAGRLPLQDQTAADGATEFSIPRLTTYAVVDLTTAR